MRLLVCEDNKIVTKTLLVVFERGGFEVDLAEDGKKAFDFLKKIVYDLVVMDIHLPFHSGLEIIRFMRSELKNETPVLILSAFSDPEIQRQAGELGIDGYVIKPFNPAEIAWRIRKILKLDQ